MGILKLVLRRLALGVFTLLVVSLGVFVLTQILGDPARAVLGRQATPESIAAFNEQYGLNDPFFVQYFRWLKGLLTGDPGVSYSNGQPIMDFLGDRIYNSLFLMFMGSIISVPLSLAIGSYAALRPRQGLRHHELHRFAHHRPPCPSSSSAPSSPCSSPPTCGTCSRPRCGSAPVNHPGAT